MNEKFAKYMQMNEAEIEDAFDNALDEQLAEFGHLGYTPPEFPLEEPDDDEIDKAADLVSKQELRTEFAEEREAIRIAFAQHIKELTTGDNATIHIDENMKIELDEEDVDAILIEFMEETLDGMEG